MKSSGSQSASQVCTTCKTRKKRCDKTLPSCGYCAQRSLRCHYQKTLPIRRADAVVRDPATRQWHLPAVAADRAASSSGDTQRADYLPPTISLYEYLRTGVGTALGNVLYNEVSRVIESAGLLLHEIGDRFLDGFHRWLPVICPQNFRKTIADSHGRAYKADFSVLLLAMCLIVVRPQSSRQQQSSTCLKTLYMTVKFYFAQAQAVLCASTPLIQAGILIAAYEYACQRPDTAYVSIGTCARMSAILGINRGKAHWDRGPPDARSTLEILEERNMWWGVIVLER